MKILIIANPVSGGGRGEGICGKISLLLLNKGHKAELFFTGAPGSAMEKTSGLTSDFDCLLIVGGDGTVNEVINGLLPADIPPRAVFPAGTANMLAKELNIPAEPHKFVELLETFHTRKIDLGKIAYNRAGESQATKKFIFTVSSGFDAMVTKEIKKRRNGPLGYCGYIIPILKIFSSYQAPRLRVIVDSARSVEGAMVVVSNIKNYGRLFSITDKAECDSGHLDICVMKKGSLAALLSYGFSAWKKKISSRKDIVYLTGREIKITSEKPVAVEADGDYLCETAVEITLEPGEVTAVINNI